MLQSIVSRRAAEVRLLLEQGTFAGARAPLRNGGTLPAEMFAKVALADLTRLSALHQSDDTQWQQLAEDIELLHETALALEYAKAEHDRFPA
jgi:hypothetical protein